MGLFWDLFVSYENNLMSKYKLQILHKARLMHPAKPRKTKHTANNVPITKAVRNENLKNYNPNSLEQSR